MAAVVHDKPGPLAVWWLAARSRTLPVAFAPVLLGTAIAASEDSARGGPAAASLAVALLLQIASNLSNDLFDQLKGADTHDRIGPPRAMQQGWLEATDLERAIVGVLVAAAVVGSYLVWLGGWPIAVLGLAAGLAAIAYTGGPWPFGYKGLGDPAVFFFFGIVAVTGTHYLQTAALSGQALLASLSIGALATAILVVNNVRDIETDSAAGKRTLAVVLGRRGARLEYTGLLATAYALLPVYATLPGRSPWVLLPLLSLPLAWPCLRAVWRASSGPVLNAALAGTARLTLVFAILLSLGWLS